MQPEGRGAEKIQEPRSQQKVFIADDKFPDVVDALKRRGWIRSRNASSPNFLLKWRNLSNVNFRLLRSDQFVNHIFNSQQLSNKALLTGHLAFQHDSLYHRQQQSQQRQHHLQLLQDQAWECSADSSPSAPSCAASAIGTGTPSSNDDGGPACKINSSSDAATASPSYDTAFDSADPESFFPRCLDVSDVEGAGVCSMLRAFTVSAAVALLRLAVEAEAEGRRKNNEHSRSNVSGGSINKGADAGVTNAAALAAASAIASRYVHLLQSSKVLSSEAQPASAEGDSQDHRPCGSCKRRRVGLACSGTSAADAIVTFGDPESVAVLTAWESAAAKGVRDTTERASKEAGAAMQELSIILAKLGLMGGFTSYTTSSAGGGGGSKLCSQIQECEERELDEGNGGVDFCLGRAKETLRLLDEDADPQAAICLGSANAWVVKPTGSSCGRGVEVVSSLQALTSACRRLEWKAVVQKYVERPLLVQGYKFDVRQWVLLTSINPLTVWGFDESYIRFSSRPFTMNASSLSDRRMHLCNHSVQKEEDQGLGARQSAQDESGGEGGIPAADDGSGGDTQALPSGSQGHMWTARQLREHLRGRCQGRDVFQEVVLPRIRSVVVQTLLGARESLEMKGRAIEWLGFDLMVTNDLRVALIEVNVSPDVSHSTPVTARLVPAATEDALSLLLDEGEADVRGSAPALPERRPDRAQSASEITRKSGVGPSTSTYLPIAVERSGTSGDAEAASQSFVCDSWVGGRQEEESSPVGKLQWQLWHKGKGESQTCLRNLRDEKKAWFEARRLETLPRHPNKNDDSFVKNKHGVTTSVVKSSANSAAAVAVPTP